MASINVEKALADYGLSKEQYEQLIKDCEDKLNGLNDYDWADLVKSYNLDVSSDFLRKSFTGLIGGANIKQYYEEKLAKNNSLNDDEYLVKLDEKKRELERARIKLNSDKVEYNKWLRENVRNEMIVKKIVEAIKFTSPLSFPDAKVLSDNVGHKEYLLTFADCHYGAEFSLKGLYGDIINEYNPEIFKLRMDELLEQVIALVFKEDIEILNIFNLADDIDGLLRVSQLVKLRFGVVQQTIDFANYISCWLNELSKYVVIKYHQTLGNHDQIRQLGMPKNTFVEDNMMKIILEFIKAKTEGNDNIEIIENPTSYCYAKLCGFPILGIHGEVKSMSKAIDDFTNMYKTPISYLIGAHLHHDKRETVGVNREVLNIPSIVGCDDYSMSLGKTSNAGASLFVFEENKGKICEYSLKFSN